MKPLRIKIEERKKKQDDPFKIFKCYSSHLLQPTVLGYLLSKLKDRPPVFQLLNVYYEYVFYKGMVEVFQFLSPQGWSHIGFYFIYDERVEVYDVAYRVSYGLFRLEVVFQPEQMMADYEFDELMSEVLASLKP